MVTWPRGEASGQPPGGCGELVIFVSVEAAASDLSRLATSLGLGGCGQVDKGAGDEKDQARDRLAGFRRELYRCLGRRADALSEACDAVLCKQDRVHMLAELSLEPE